MKFHWIHKVITEQPKQQFSKLLEMSGDVITYLLLSCSENLGIAYEDGDVLLIARHEINETQVHEVKYGLDDGVWYAVIDESWLLRGGVDADGNSWFRMMAARVAHEVSKIEKHE